MICATSLEIGRRPLADDTTQRARALEHALASSPRPIVSVGGQLKQVAARPIPDERVGEGAECGRASQMPADCLEAIASQPIDPQQHTERNEPACLWWAAAWRASSKRQRCATPSSSGRQNCWLCVNYHQIDSLRSSSLARRARFTARIRTLGPEKGLPGNKKATFAAGERMRIKIKR